MPTDVFLGFDADPGLQPCDRCEVIQLCQLFGCFYLCRACLERAMDALGLECAGRGIARLSGLHQREQRLRSALMDLNRIVEEFLDDCAEQTVKSAELLGEVRTR